MRHRAGSETARPRQAERSSIPAGQACPLDMARRQVDAARGVFFGGALSTSQLIAVPAALLAVLMLLRLGRSAGASKARKNA